MQNNIQRYYDRWKRELGKTARHMGRWSKLCKYSLIRPLAEHRLSCEIVFALSVIRKLQEDFYNTKKLISGYFKENSTESAEDLLAEIDCDVIERKMPVLKCKFEGDKTFIRHSAIAAYYKKGEETLEAAREICNQVIHSYIWTMAYNKKELLGVAIASDKKKEACLYVVKIADLIDYVKYCRDIFLPSAQKLSALERKLTLFEILHGL